MHCATRRGNDTCCSYPREMNRCLDFSRPGKPTDNAFIESVNGRLRDECLNQHWFLSLDEARAVTEAWRDDYNRVRPHGALGNQTPFEFARPCMANNPTGTKLGAASGAGPCHGRSSHTSLTAPK